MQGLFPKSSAMAIHSWLYRLLSRRDLRSADQRPLFRYQLSIDEYSELLVLLREAPQKGNVANDSAYCGAFCLFCAEWYRREYQVTDGWSWDPLWKRLGYELSAQELAKIIPKGLEQFWQRPIRFYESDRRNFLGSLFSEGGLPFQVLTEPDSRFQALFTRVLKQYEASQIMAGSIETVVRSQVEQLKLPQVFREQTSIELIVQMADQLAQLVDLYKLEKSEQPVEVLDSSYSHWRESFPIPLDDQTGRGFLNGLLKTASKEARKAKHSGQKLSCEHYWLPESGNLEVKITLPIELTLDVDIQPVSNRFDLSIHEGKKLLASIGPGYARVSHSLIEVRVRHQNLVCRRKAPSKALFVVASIGGQAVASKEIPASVLDLGTVPIGFEARDDSNRWRCVGQNSFRTQAEELVLLVPALSQLSSDDCTLVRQTSSHSETNQWLVSGKGQVKCEQEDVFSIRLGDTLASHSQVKLKGYLLQYPTRPSNTYIGLPQAVPEQSAGLEHERLQVFLGGRAVESCHLNQRLGSQRLTVKSSAGETLLRRKVGVLPADFSIEIQPGTQPSQGYVRFRSSLSCFIEWMTEGVKAQRLPASDVIEYELTSGQEFPPAQVAVRVYPNLEADPIEIDLPFPTVGVVALNEHDQPLPKRLSVDELLGTRLYLFARPDCSVKYRIDMRLPKSSASRAAYIWHYLAKPEQPVEISLYEMRSKIESLLSLEEGIDQQVQLSISGYGKSVEYTIQRHALTLNWDKARNLLYKSTLLSGDERTLCPVLMLLHEPERKPLEIPSRRSEGVATGEFEIPALVEKNGPWLVLPHRDSAVSFRPFFIAGEFDQPPANAEIQNLQRAVQAFDPSSSCAFKPVLQQMVSNPGIAAGSLFSRSIKTMATCLWQPSRYGRRW